MKASDYPMVCRWWDSHHKGEYRFLPENCLPVTGVVACNERFEPQSACFAWQTNSAIAFVGFLVTNPELTGREWLTYAKEAVDQATQIARSFTDESGFVQILTHDPAFKKLAIRHCGYSDGGDAVMSAHLLIDGGIDPGAIT